MEEMYSLGLSIHSYFVYALLFGYALHVTVIYKSKELKKFRRVRTLFLAPLNSVLLGVILFTGVVMMAAKHLDFTLANIAMIVVSLLLIVLEVRMTKMLRYVQESDFASYKTTVLKTVTIEVLVVILLSIWMFAL
jgi:hypothetical protein